MRASENQHATTPNPGPRIPSLAAMVLSCAALLVFLAIRSQSAQTAGQGCTVVTVAHGGRVVFAGNDDYVDRDTVVWIDPAAPGRYGALWIGTRDNVQQGFNEKGLA